MPIYPPKLSTTLCELQSKLEKPRERTRAIYHVDLEERQELHKRKEWIKLREAKKNNFDAYVKACGMPKIFQGVKFSVDEECFLRNSLFITGGFGTGKTYKAVSILKGFIKNLPCGHFIEPFKNIPIFITIPELLMEIRSYFNSATISEMDALKRYFDSPLLILDDLGVEKTTEWALQSLYVIINKRLSEERETIITSNLSLDELKDKIGDRIVSRIVGMCKVIKLVGKDRRLTYENRTQKQ